MLKKTPKQAARYFKQRAQMLKKGIIDTEQRNARDLKRMLISLGSGKVMTPVRVVTPMAFTPSRGKNKGVTRTIRVRQYIFPYAASHPDLAFDPQIINIRTGRFNASWNISGPMMRGEEVRTIIANLSWYSHFMYGTSRMVPRRIDLVAAKQIEPLRNRRLAALLNRVVPP